MIPRSCDRYKIFWHRSPSFLLPSTIPSLSFLVVCSFSLIATQNCGAYFSLARSEFISFLVSLSLFFSSLLNELIPPLSLWCFVAIAFVFRFSTIAFLLRISFLATFSLWLVAFVRAGLSLQVTASAFFWLLLFNHDHIIGWTNSNQLVTELKHQLVLIFRDNIRTI